MSLILRPVDRDDPTRLSLLPLLASVSAAEALEAVAGLTVRLRWPNDLYRDDKKLGGVLCESSFSGSSLEHAIVGLGINVNQTEESFSRELTASATSMRCLLQRSFDRLEIAAHIVAQLEQWWHQRQSEAVLARFRELAEGVEGRSIRIRASDESSYVGTSRGISREGGLRVELSDGTERVLFSDDVLLVRPCEENYYASVEKHFIERRGSPLFITPSEWQLVWKWEQQGIPLNVVKEGIDRVFERPAARRRPRKLGYCRQTVEAAHRRFCEAALGVSRSSVEDESKEVREHWHDLVTKLREARQLWRERDESIAEAVASCEGRLEALLARFTAESLVEAEEALSSEEERLLDAIENRLGAERRESILQEAEASLADYRHRMPENVHASAVRSAYRRRLRLEIGIPTLSLLDR
jgi:biotin-[acetyl-CoA-carboxylase] ligase BirA-like protein